VFGEPISVFAHDLLANSVHIPTSTLFQAFEVSLKEHLVLHTDDMDGGSRSETVLLVNLSRPSSFCLLLAGFWPLVSHYRLYELRDGQLVSLEVCDGDVSDDKSDRQAELVVGPRHVVILDDIMFTGSTVVGILDEITYFWNKRQTTLPRFHVVTAYASAGAIHAFQNFRDDQNIDARLHTRLLEAFHPLTYLNQRPRQYAAPEKILRLFGESTSVPITLDYSDPQEMSSFRHVYTKGAVGDSVAVGPLLPPPDRDAINFIFDSLTTKRPNQF
jgi:hypothetical protein